MTDVYTVDRSDHSSSIHSK